VSASRGWRVSLVGATGAVGEELLRVLEEQRFPVLELRAFASGESEGREVDFRGEAIPVERVDAGRVAEADLVLCAAPGILEALRTPLVQAGTPVIDLSGVLELDPDVPLHLPGDRPGTSLGPLVAVPRGIVAGLALALRPLRAEVELRRLTVVTLESAAGAGRRGAGELSDQTVHLLSAMTGEAGESETFPQPLAFDCLPIVGERLPDGDTTEERRLGHVLRRLLGTRDLPIEATRVRVPIFGGSLGCVHVELAEPLPAARARELWAKAAGLAVLDEEELPTPRARVGRDPVAIGRIRAGEGDRASLAFVAALDDLRLGAAVNAVEVAKGLLGG
jgi:aspartate-semialdehyde dehydrogenase